MSNIQVKGLEKIIDLHELDTFLMGTEFSEQCDKKNYEICKKNWYLINLFSKSMPAKGISFSNTIKKFARLYSLFLFGSSEVSLSINFRGHNCYCTQYCVYLIHVTF